MGRGVHIGPMGRHFVRPGGARRSAVGARTAALATACLLAVGLAALDAAPADAGQIVYAAGTGIWAMNEDGSGKHELVDATQVPGMGFIGDPDVQPNGTEVAFMGRWDQAAYEESKFGAAPGFCGGNCEGYYELRNGAVTRVSPAPFDCGGQPCASYEYDPRVASDGSVAYVFQEWTSRPEFTTWSPVLGRSFLLSRDASGGSQQKWETACEWTTDANQEATEATVLAVDPANPNEIAYGNCAQVSKEECELGYVSGYDIYLSGANRGSASDDELVDTVEDPGARCLEDAHTAIGDLSFSPDGGHLVEMHGGSGAGVYTYPATAGASPQELLAITGDWLFYAVRYIGANRVAVTAGRDTNEDGEADHIDIYSFSAGCTPATCSLETGQGVTNLTGSGNVRSDEILRSSNFGYTSSNEPIAALSTPGAGAGSGGRGGHGGGRGSMSVSISKIPTQHLRKLLAKGLRVGVSCSAPCRLAGSLVVPAKVAKKLHLRHGKPRNVVIGRGKATLAKPGKATLVIHIFKSAGRRLRHARSLRLLFGLVATNGAGANDTLSRPVLVKH